MSDLPRTRAEALSLGLPHYFTGKPCKHGHIAERRAKGDCVECARRRQRAEANPERKREGDRRYREANRDKRRESKRQWDAANPEKERERKRKWKAANRDKVRENSRRYRESNPEKERERKHKWLAENADKERERSRKRREANPEKERERSRKRHAANPEKARRSKAKWREANPEKRAAHRAARRARKLTATPPWADMAAIEAIYAERVRVSAETGIEHHVDHIAPLRGRNVCGLHVPWNLRVIPATENLAKGAKMI